MKKIFLKKEKFAKVDDEDFLPLSKYTWRCSTSADSGHSYAIGGVERKQISMHRHLMDTPQKLVCDHIDGDGLNNQKSNLRNITRQQNTMNCKRKDGKWKGVRKDYSGRFYAGIRVDGKSYVSKMVDSRRAAAEEYDKLALKHHKEFASLNFPPATKF